MMSGKASLLALKLTTDSCALASAAWADVDQTDAHGKKNM